MKIFEIEDYMDHLDHIESKWFLEINHINHSNGLTSYQIINIRKSHLTSIHITFVKDELKIWMDLNGFKLTGKKIIIGHMYDKLHIYFESFELKN